MATKLLVLFLMKIGNPVHLRHASLRRPESIKSIDDSIQDRTTEAIGIFENISRKPFASSRWLTALKNDRCMSGVAVKIVIGPKVSQ
jgi:hypothetical protein